LVLFLSFPLAGAGCFVLCRELWRDDWAAALAGLFYAFSTYHVAHAQMQLHLAELQWSPLFFYGVIRLTKYGRTYDGLLAGGALSLACLASIYHLWFCLIAFTVLAACGVFGSFRELLSDRLGPLVALAATFALCCGWLLAGITASVFAEPYVGRHDTVRFSADLQSFFVPNAVTAWSRWFDMPGRWTGTAFENAAYIGYVPLGLAVFGVTRVPRARPYLWLASAGALLALGPWLHIGGVIYSGLTLPEGWLEALLPPLRFSGVPVRYTWLTTFGVAVAAGAGLHQLCARGLKGRTAAVLLTVIGLVEVWPQAFPTAGWTVPDILRTWASDTSEWAVVDGTEPSRALWNQMAHHHPIIGGYVTRTPEKLWDALEADPVLRPLLPATASSGDVPLTVPAEQARAFLRARRIRFVIVPEVRTNVPSQMGLVKLYHGEGLVIFAMY